MPFDLVQGPLLIEPPRATDLALPKPNPFLPRDLALLPADDASIALTVDRPGLQLWLDTDVSFTTPKANIAVELLVPNGLVSLQDSSYAQLLVRLLKDEMTKPTYPALLAGLDFGLTATSSGFAITTGGYNDKQREFLAFVLDRVLTAPLSQARFDTIKHSLVRDLQNTTKDKPYNQALTALNNALLSSSWPAENRRIAESTSLAQLESWRGEQFKTLAVTVVCMATSMLTTRKT